MIELQNVSFSYEGHRALNDISLKIEKGESVSLLGANGTGKSTLLKLLCGIVTPDSGTYAFDGREITQKALKDPKFSKQFHQRIGFVFQNSDTQLFCTNVFDEVAFGPRQMGYDERAVEERVESCLSLLELQDYKDRQPYHLSGGEKKKVAIASVLAMNPEVLVLDEPMNGLDPKTERWLAGFLVELLSSGKTLIVSTHNLELVQEISKRAVLFDSTHAIAADLQTHRLLDDIELLKRVNLVDKYYHRHDDGGHGHYHIHNY
ncbi:cobalt/nickel transport system ATP-binding protein [Sporobacter termitidis DSM 10068]|uniref:Cobalt/nickel transport system ATP-binding protein n=1 Tax=Sporobacter termitidis DSM 10068 TaxID=1123282 RepID=A0A1M5XH84_9FIRM|nr:ABC transporter ATP-binding protein [Sporobacter termitidis]SHH98992.1 cobalt/nickel transport system ATP-binding protein [Sporobacter termitidis DSM 10068]